MQIWAQDDIDLSWNAGLEMHRHILSETYGSRDLLWFPNRLIFYA